MEALCQHLTARTVNWAYRDYRHSDGKDFPNELKEPFVAECEHGLSQMNLICAPNHASLHMSTRSYLLLLNVVGPTLVKFNPVPCIRSWVATGHRIATVISCETKNREEVEHWDTAGGIWDNMDIS